MIVSFANKETEKLAKGMRVRKFEAIGERARVKLRMLDIAAALIDLRSLPSSRLEGLSGDRNGQYSIRINDQYRICFRFEEGNAHDVEIVDYH